MSITDTLAERGKHYEGPGGYEDTAYYSQRIKRLVRKSPNGDRLTDVQLESLDMIANKLARILCGNPNHADSWHDIAGYATLAEKAIEAQKPNISSASLVEAAPGGVILAESQAAMRAMQAVPAPIQAGWEGTAFATGLGWPYPPGG